MAKLPAAAAAEGCVNNGGQCPFVLSQYQSSFLFKRSGTRSVLSVDFMADVVKVQQKCLFLLYIRCIQSST